MKYINAVGIVILALCSAFLAHEANATVIKYDMNFESSVAGPAGTGSYYWDDVNHVISNMTWNFGGNIGGVDDALIDWNAPYFGQTYAEYIFSYLNGNYCPNTSCYSIITGPVSEYGYPANLGYSLFISWDANGHSNYFFNKLNSPLNPLLAGGFSTSRVTVPEPASMFLLGIGLFSLFFFQRRKKWATTTQNVLAHPSFLYG